MHSMTSGQFSPQARQDQTCFIKTLLGASVRVAHVREEGKQEPVYETGQKENNE